MGDNLRKISINLDLLKIPSNGGTRKKRAPTEKKFKIKTPPKAQNNKSLKRNLLKFIRDQQDKKLKNGFEIAPPQTHAIDDFKSDFNESIAFLSDVSKKTDEQAK